MKDYAHIYTDEKLEEIEKELIELYASASKELDSQLIKIEKQIAKMTGENSTSEQRLRLLKEKNRIEKSLYYMSEKIQDCNETAIKIFNKESLNIYSEKYNFGLFTMQKQSGIKFNFELFNDNLIKQFIDKNMGVFNYLAIDNVKDFGNIKREVERIFFVELLKGSSIGEIANALNKVLDKNMNKIITIVRTETTRIENASRLDAFIYGEKLGLDLEKEWIATIDGRTRKSHRGLNGQRVPIDEPFSNGLMYPGADGSADEVIGCRCTMTSDFKGFTKQKAWQEWRGDIG